MSTSAPCPNCGGPMRAISLAAHYGKVVEIDHCAACRVLWFDQMETATLAREGLLELFRLIAESSDSADQPLRQRLACPRCGEALNRIHNMSRYGRMIHHRCPSAHGHAVTHAQFLAEKGLLRKVTPADLAMPGKQLLGMACTQCGAPLHALKDCNCPYCNAPVVMLDLARALESLEDHDRLRREAEAQRAASQDAALEKLMQAIQRR
ncbi:zf-TFIIB domain-containing protein [Niveibacterium sp. 24ML]|uniref:zf-TFIIB domain-containing protein n=1 Tax=Niveibacterium sp. 24ML TaxID=2985512 RepID=UPI00226ED92A|nr:zf-TFIIB domain-containing protein [Niveibacterium sp. 24ML]MCX9155085.1 zf-TFIIB domain-containing protein [Niveibacterium sp. 24ML]